MKKSQLTTILIVSLKDAIEHDLQLYESDARDRFIFLKYVEEVGMVAPLDWIKDYPQWEDKWEKFMNGQSVSHGGFYVRDVSKFLSAIEMDLKNDQNNTENGVKAGQPSQTHGLAEDPEPASG